MTCWKKPRQTKWLFPALATLLLTAARTPEQLTLDAAKLVRPLSDERWAEIAKDQLGQEYEIIRGDTLWGISQRLFGEGNYWPKVWALNGQSIPNPHWIYPGRKLIFRPGTGSSLPLLALAGEGAGDGTEPTASDIPRTLGRSQEWRDLPAQEWEQVQTTLPAQVDPQGIDTRTRYEIPRTTGFDLHKVAQSNEAPILGRIRSSGSRQKSLVAGETIFFEAAEDITIEPGKVLTLSRAPGPLESRESGREGWIYSIEGQVQVIGPSLGPNGDSSERLWTGRILRSVDPSRRQETILIDLPIRRQPPALIPAPEALTAQLSLGKDRAGSLITQHELAFIDRGSEDGVTDGMVFRAYQYTDLNTNTEATRDDVLPLADCVVVDVSEKFSTVLMISSKEIIPDGTPLKALTDLSSLRRKGSAGAKDLDGTSVTPTPSKSKVPINELDALEEDGSLSDEEKRNLQQLEQKKEAEKEVPPNLEETPTAPIPEGEATPAPTPKAEPSPAPSPAAEEETAAPPEQPAEQPEAPPDF